MTYTDIEPSFRGLAPDISWVWQVDDPGQWAKMLSWLSDDEKEAVESFGSPKRRLEYVLGRTAARRLVADRLGVSPREVVLQVADDGAVEVGATGLCLSISHAGGWATAAVSSRPVGIDMERLARRSPGVYRYFLSKKEYALLEGTGLDHDRLQILLWALKESVLKGMRTGLRISPRDIEIVSMDASGAARVTDRDGGQWRLCWTFWRGCYLAIADRENLP